MEHDVHACGRGCERGQVSDRRAYRVRQNLSFVISPFTPTTAPGVLQACGSVSIPSCASACVAKRDGSRRPAPPSSSRQSVKTTERSGPHGYDGAKKLSGRKRHVLVDTLGLVLGVLAHPAD